jgi:hypothetical protein
MHTDIIERCHNTIYVQYGCDNQSKVVYSLNHDITASFTLNSDPEFPKSDLLLILDDVTGCGRTHMPGEIIERCHNNIYVQYGQERHSKVV